MANQQFDSIEFRSQLSREWQKIGLVSIVVTIDYDYWSSGDKFTNRPS